MGLLNKRSGAEMKPSRTQVFPSSFCWDILGVLAFTFRTFRGKKEKQYFFFFWPCWVFVAAHGLSLVAASGGYSSLQCVGFSLRWHLFCRARALGSWASVVVALGLSSCGSWALERRLSSCGTWAQLLRGMWDLPGPGLEPMSPALAGRFITTAPPGKPLDFILETWLQYFPYGVVIGKDPFSTSLFHTLLSRTYSHPTFSRLTSLMTVTLTDLLNL